MNVDVAELCQLASKTIKCKALFGIWIGKLIVGVLVLVCSIFMVYVVHLAVRFGLTFKYLLQIIFAMFAAESANFMMNSGVKIWEIFQDKNCDYVAPFDFCILTRYFQLGFIFSNGLCVVVTLIERIGNILHFPKFPACLRISKKVPAVLFFIPPTTLSAFICLGVYNSSRPDLMEKPQVFCYGPSVVKSSMFDVVNLAEMCLVSLSLVLLITLHVIHYKVHKDLRISFTTLKPQKVKYNKIMNVSKVFIVIGIFYICFVIMTYVCLFLGPLPFSNQNPYVRILWNEIASFVYFLFVPAFYIIFVSCIKDVRREVLQVFGYGGLIKPIKVDIASTKVNFTAVKQKPPYHNQTTQVPKNEVAVPKNNLIGMPLPPIVGTLSVENGQTINQNTKLENFESCAKEEPQMRTNNINPLRQEYHARSKSVNVNRITIDEVNKMKPVIRTRNASHDPSKCRHIDTENQTLSVKGGEPSNIYTSLEENIPAKKVTSIYFNDLKTVWRKK
uniref:G_PROTEIN_RECEP_F1_2 domain-containing protein n=1 Tax=Rhabditophanes sp. KR3021 TaxID=114890 RepID=A0AC35TYC4_9BILA